MWLIKLLSFYAQAHSLTNRSAVDKPEWQDLLKEEKDDLVGSVLFYLVVERCVDHASCLG